MAFCVAQARKKRREQAPVGDIAYFESYEEMLEPPITVEDGIRMSLLGIIAHKSALLGGALLPIPDIDEL